MCHSGVESLSFNVPEKPLLTHSLNTVIIEGVLLLVVALGFEGDE